MLQIPSVSGSLVLSDKWVPVLDNAKAKTLDFERSTSNVGSGVSAGISKATSSVLGFDKSISDLAKSAGTKLTVGLTLPLVAASGAILKLGMEAVESENLVSVSFGNMKGAADTWSKGLSQNLGLNEFELRKTAGTLFNMTTSMGLARDEAFKMSTGVAELAADMASFRNIPMEEALTKIRAGLVGESEPLKAIGILVDENTVKQEAYRIGLVKQGEQLTQTQKVQARWSAILRQTANDQGDLARTMDSPTNQLRVMKERITGAATELGMSLMPTFSTFVGMLATGAEKTAGFLKWFGQLPEAAKMTGIALVGLTAALGPVLFTTGKLIQLWGIAAPAATLFGNTIPVLTARVWLLDAAQKAAAASGLGMATTVGLIGGAIAGITFGIYKTVGAVQALNQHLKEGKSLWEFFSKRESTALSRFFGVNTGLESFPAPEKLGGKDVSLPSEVGSGAAGAATKTAIAQLAEYRKTIEGLTKAQRDEITAAQQLGGPVLDNVLKKYDLTDAHLRVMSASVKENKAAVKDAAAEFKEWTRQIDYLQGQREIIKGAFANSAEGLRDFLKEGRIKEVILDPIKQIPPVVDLNTDALKRLGNEAGDAFNQTNDESKKFFDNLHDEAMKMQNLGEDITRMVIGGFMNGDLGRQVGAFFGQMFGESMGESIKNAIGKFTKLGGFLGGILGPLGQIGGELLGGLLDKGLGKLFKREGRLVNDIRDEFLGGFGASGTGAGSGLQNLDLKLRSLGTAGEQMFQRLLRASKENDVKGAIDDITKALEEQKNKQEAAADATEKATEDMAKKQEEATADIRKNIASLDNQYQSLADSIKDEQLEDVMGIAEANTRQRMADVAREKSNLEQQLKDMLERISNMDVDAIQIPYEYVLRGETPEGINPVPPNSPVSGAQGLMPGVTINNNIDGRAFSKAIAPHLAETMDLYGVSAA